MTVEKFILSIILGAFAGIFLGRLEPDTSFIVTLFIAFFIVVLVLGFGENDEDGDN